MLNRDRSSRRDFMKTSAGAAAASAFLHEYLGDLSYGAAAPSDAKNDRPRLGSIGVGGRGSGIMRGARRYADLVAVADVDLDHAERAREKTGGKAKVYQDYRKLLERGDIDVLTIGTPDHWHTRICAEALKAGIDVYCEKPLTLTIDEGKYLCKVVKDTGRILQVGTQQRTEMGRRFLTAVALVRAGRIGKLQRVTTAIGRGPSGGPFKETAAPSNLDWDFWLGQTRKVAYIKERCHNTFRWWYEYSGGKLTDWGAHHIDIAQMGMEMEHTGPLWLAGEAEHPNVANGYNTATKFKITAMFPGDIELIIYDRAPKFGNGILFEGTEGHVYVDRGKINGPAVDALADNPLPDDAITKIYKGDKPDRHMGNFFRSVASRREPVSDVWSHHRVLTTCHLANICIRVGRKITWDAKAEQIVGDSQANLMLSRPQRRTFESVA